MKHVFLLLVLCAVAFGQQASSDGDKLITVPQKYVSAEGMQHQSDGNGAVVDQIMKWKGIGQEIGIATRESLNAVVDVAEKFGTTNVGHYVMFLVAWKLVGKDMLSLIFGIPIWFFGVAIWVWLLKWFFVGKRVLVKYDEITKTKYYEMTHYKFDSSDARSGCAWALGAFIVAWCVVWIALIF